MTLTVELPASVEQQVRQRAAAVGYAPEAIIADLVQDHFSAAATVPDALTEAGRNGEAVRRNRGESCSKNGSCGRTCQTMAGFARFDDGPAWFDPRGR